MQNEKRIRTRHVNSIYQDEDIKLPLFRKHTSITSHTKVYHNHFHLLHDLSKLELLLYLFLMNNLDNNNCVTNSLSFRLFFVNCSDKQYNDKSVNGAFSNLARKEIIIRQSRGVYMFNPDYAKKNSEKNRKILIKIAQETIRNINTGQCWTETK